MTHKHLRWIGCLFMIGTLVLATLASPTTSATEPTPTQLEREFLYVLEDLSGSSNRIHGYRIDGASGALTALGEPVETGYPGDDNANALVQRLAFHSETRRLFAINDGASNVLSIYQVDMSSGALSLDRHVELDGGAWNCVAVHPGGSPVLLGGAVAGESGAAVGRVASYIIDESGVSAAPGSPGDAGAAVPYSCRFSQDGRYFYAGGYGPSEIAGFEVDAADGAITSLPGSPFDAGVSYPAAYATDDQGRLFVADSLNTNTPLQAFTTNEGIPTAVTDGTFASGLNYAYDGLWHPAGYYLVATLNSQAGVYRISGENENTVLEPVTGSPFTAGGSILALNRSGTMLFAASLIGGIFSSTFDARTGELALSSSIDTGPDAPVTFLSGMAYAATPPPPAVIEGYLYALRETTSGNQIYGYQIDAATGNLTLLADFPLASGGTGTGKSGERLAFDPVYSRLYAVNASDATLSAFQVDLETGALTPLSGSPFSLGNSLWTCIDVHPDGSPVIVGGIEQIGLIGSIASFQANATMLEAAGGSPIRVGGTGIETCALSPGGDYFYLAGPDFGVYQVDQQNGSLAAVPGSPFFSGAEFPHSLIADNENRLFLTESTTIVEDNPLYGEEGQPITRTTLIQANHVFALNDGIPTAMSSSPFELKPGPQPTAALWHPAGYYLVGNTGSLDINNIGSSLGVFRIQGSGVASSLELVPSDPVADPPRLFPVGTAGLSALTMDHSGTRLFTGNDLTGSLQSLQFDPATGVVEGLFALPQGALGGTSVQIGGLAYAIALPDLAIEISSSSIFAPDTEVTYSLQVINRSTIDATTTISITSELPAGMSFRSNPSTGWDCSTEQQQLTCRHPGPLAGGAALPDLVLIMHIARELPAPPAFQASLISPAEASFANNTASFVPQRESQQIQFAEIPSLTLNTAPFALSAQASSGLTVQLSTTSPDVCTVEESVLTVHTAGECTIIARQPGNWQFRPAPEVWQRVSITGLAPERTNIFLPLVLR